MSVSVWEKESFYAPCDVLIVGAGLLGLWTARELKIKRPSQKVTLIDKDITASGASMRNAGFACFGSPSELLHDEQLMGADKMWEIVSMRFNGIKKIRAVLGDELIGFENTGGYEGFAAADDNDWPMIEQQLERLNAGFKSITGHADLYRVADEKLAINGLTGFAHLIENKLEGTLHSGKLVAALLANVVELGVNVIGGSNLQGMKKRTMQLA